MSLKAGMWVIGTQISDSGSSYRPLEFLSPTPATAPTSKSFWLQLRSKVAWRPWAPRTFLEFAIKTGYVLDPWKIFCCAWAFSGVLESS